MAAFLKQEGYTRPYERHTELPQPEKKRNQEVHEEWEMDAQGVIDAPSPFPTLFHLWLIALGIDVRFIESPPPTDHNLPD